MHQSTALNAIGKKQERDPITNNQYARNDTQRAKNKAQYQQNAPTDWFEHLQRDWLVDGKIDKPAYFCCHMKKADEYAQHPDFERIGEDGGFVFFRRSPR